jgi:hypothetical protein
MTYKELDEHLMETLDNEVADMRQVSWQDLEKLHMVTSVLAVLWHPAMKSRMEHKEVQTHHEVKEAVNEGSYLKTATPIDPNHRGVVNEPKRHHFYNT